jgi:hypothetical protein
MQSAGLETRDTADLEVCAMFLRLCVWNHPAFSTGLAEISSIRSIGRNIKLTLAAPNKSYEQEEQHQETNSKCPTSSLT